MQKLILRPSFPLIQTEIGFARHLEENEFFIRFCRSLAKKGAVLADAHVGKGAEKIAKALGSGFEVLSLAGGEASKTRDAKEKLENELLKKKYGRDSLLIGMGGGVATDLSAFLASTYLRGVPLILIPTSLLAMVDAAIGGKTGVDTPYGKNQIGTFYFPKAIFIDGTLLSTLPEKEWSNGLAEIAKYGLIADPSIWKKLEEDPYGWKKPEPLEELIQASIRIKMGVVEKDPLELTGLRRTLNFGHTVGHALELLSEYRLDHGQAVAIGCIAESFLSHRLGSLPQEALNRIVSLFGKLGFSLQWSKKWDKNSIWEAMSADKKSKGGEVRSVFLQEIGKCVPFDGEYCKALNKDEVDAMAGWMQRNYTQ